MKEQTLQEKRDETALGLEFYLKLQKSVNSPAILKQIAQYSIAYYELNENISQDEQAYWERYR